MEPKIEAALTFLKSAIARHERHMNGSEATDMRSQQMLMDDMKSAATNLQQGLGMMRTAGSMAR